jgi:hypothetical protein
MQVNGQRRRRCYDAFYSKKGLSMPKMKAAVFVEPGCIVL